VNDTYLAGHIQEALTHAGETDVHVAVDFGRVVITGTVATEARRDVVRAITMELTDLEVADEVTVLHCEEPTGEEHIP
jgi:hypothetical protein